MKMEGTERTRKSSKKIQHTYIDDRGTIPMLEDFFSFFGIKE
jgi:hypothetical protein